MKSSILAGVAVAAIAVSGLGAGIGASASASEPVSAKRPASAQDLLEGLRPTGYQAQASSQVGARTLRLHGANRYETAASVSEALWDYENTIVVSLVSGENFPDALSLGPSLAPLGPTLLVSKNDLPPATRAELQRLRPCVVVAAGGAGTISDGVLQAADQYTDPAC